jgi:thiamine-monophosphate kinase
MRDSSLTVAQIGEQGLLKRIFPFCATHLVGDDAAIIPRETSQDLVVTTDILVDGVHFSDRTTPPDSVGWRGATANLSDLAAMGANPLGITVGLGLPPTLPVAWVEGLYQGLTACLERYRTPIVGGDICRSPVITVSITALGQVLPQKAIYRHLAQVGDKIVITGWHGLAKAGLELLLGNVKGDYPRLRQAHQYPLPRLDVLPLLEKIIPSRAIAGMDSSDGLADAVVQICRASGVGAQIEQSLLPIYPDLTALTSPEQALEWVLFGGEDFELVLCLPPRAAKDLVQMLKAGAAIIGTITREKSVELIDYQGNSLGVLSLEAGFQHFCDDDDSFN